MFEHREILELASYTKDGNETILINSAEIIEIDFKIKFYPIPIKDRLIINANNLTEKVQVKILDYTGKIVYSEEISFFNGKHVIEFSSYNSGIYIVELTFNDKKLTKKVLKQ